MNRALSTKQIAYVAMGVALTAVCAWISVPSLLPTMVPFTLQNFAVCLVPAVFGWRIGLWTVSTYILLGAVGAPVFSGFRGGVAVLLGTTGGYIVGFVATVIVVGLAAERLGRKPLMLMLSMAVGILMEYALGTAWYIIVYTKNSGAVSVMTAIGWCVAPYLIPDMIKIVLAACLSGRLYPLFRIGGKV